MAKVAFKSNNQEMGSHFMMGLVSVMLLVQLGSARQFTVGGSKGWTVPENATTNSYNQWAESNRFQIGDSLLFKYDSSQDSVLLVTKENYESCNTDSPISTLKDVFTFNQSGPFYFISGNKDNCQKNEKLVVTVLADRTKTQAVAPSTPPSASAPSPTPVSSPPATTVENSPSPPPSDHKKNAASPSSTSVIGYIGALFFASSIVLTV